MITSKQLRDLSSLAQTLEPKESKGVSDLQQALKDAQAAVQAVEALQSSVVSLVNALPTEKEWTSILNKFTTLFR